jgi:energy-coupling factor transporter ATP-binding protein EcfA2
VRCIELANTGALGRGGHEAVYGAWWAAAAAHPNPAVHVPDTELLSVWRSAERHAGDRPADLSGVGGPGTWGTIGGVGLAPFAAGGAAPSSAGGPVPATPPAPAAPPPAAAGLTLPEEFWAARPVLQQIRQAAHSRLVSGDVALYSTLIRLAALWPHTVRADTGAKSPASMNLFVAVVGPTGAGKSTGISVAADLVPLPPWLRRGPDDEHDPFADDVPLGTGEGIAEAYIGTSSRTVPQVDGNGDALIYATGARAGTERTKVEKTRGQVRHNVLVHADEGEALVKMLERSGATVGESVRRAWFGATIGQQNGKAETTRIVKSGTYSLGMLIGFQPETCQGLLADGAPGTPQRFLWAWAVDPTMPRARVPRPGVLAGIWGREDGQRWLVAEARGRSEPDERPVTFDPSITDELFGVLHGIGTGAVTLPQLDSHMPLTLVKVAVLLAQLDGGRRHVNLEDWMLARIVWQTSCRVRDYLVAYGVTLQGKAAAARRAAYAGQEAAAEAARAAVRDEAEMQRVARMADRIEAMLREAGPDGMPMGAMRKRFASKERPVFSDALDMAILRGRATVKHDGSTDRVVPL